MYFFFGAFPTGVSERFGRNIYCGFEVNSGEFAVIYEWSLQWNKKMSKFFTTQERGRIENCKKQASREEGGLFIKNLLIKSSILTYKAFTNMHA